MTDDLLTQLEQRIHSEYEQAAREVEDKMNNYLAAFARRDEAQLERLQNNEITQDEYNRWRLGQMAIGQRWEEMRDTLAQDLTNTNQIAAAMINGNSRDVYALNHNYGTFEVEEQSQIDTSYTLYDRMTVERLLRDDPDLLPQARIDIPEDSRWNRQQINSAVMQGVLQGESIPAIARRLQNVTNMNRTSAIRNARTMTTSAECGGRIDSYHRAEEMGIQMEQVWIATHDDRTRFTHAFMDGERVKVGETFSNGLEYPGDPNGAPEEVYNCRCTIVAVVAGADTASLDERREYWDNDERYQQWQMSKFEQMAITPNMPESQIAVVPEQYHALNKDEQQEWRDRLYSQGELEEDTDVRNALMHYLDGWRDTTEYSIQDAVVQYTSGDYSDMNALLRTGGYARGEDNGYRDAVERCIAGLSECSNPVDLIARRGTGMDTLVYMGVDWENRDVLRDFQRGYVTAEEAMERFGGNESMLDTLFGDGASAGQYIYKDEGFLSMTPGASGGFSDGLNFIIQIPEGAQVLYVDPISYYQGEDEILGNAGRSLVLRGMELVEEERAWGTERRIDVFWTMMP